MNVKGYRASLGKTQEQMAVYLGISRQAYSEKERGNIPFNDKEKIMLKKLFLEINPSVTIDSLFFN